MLKILENPKFINALCSLFARKAQCSHESFLWHCSIAFLTPSSLTFGASG